MVDALPYKKYQQYPGASITDSNPVQNYHKRSWIRHACKFSTRKCLHIAGFQVNDRKPSFVMYGCVEWLMHMLWLISCGFDPVELGFRYEPVISNPKRIRIQQGSRSNIVWVDNIILAQTIQFNLFSM